MDFTFSEDQLLFCDSVREFFSNEVTADSIRERWNTDSGRSAALWASLAELGLNGMLVPEAQGGLGMNEIDFVLLAQECGRAALPEPLIDTVFVATPLLAAIEDTARAEGYLERIATGELAVAVQSQPSSCFSSSKAALVADAEFCELLILDDGESLHAVSSKDVGLERQESVDPSRRLYSVAWDATDETIIASGEDASILRAQILNRGALASAAQLLGLAQRITDLSVSYTGERQQFGKPIASFQAVKHHMANVAVKTEFAKAPVYRAAYSIHTSAAFVDQHVSQAKLAAAEAALAAAKSGIQVHGAMGYTWEVDLQIFMKRAWVLDSAWGTRAYHKMRVAQMLFSKDRNIGAGQTF